MQYMLLIYNAESAEPRPGTPEYDELFRGYMAFTEDVKKKGILQGSHALEGVAAATTVRVRGGKAETTDGPFAETKEQLAGYYLLDCEDLDQAIECAARIPSAAFGAVEVRPVRVFE